MTNISSGPVSLIGLHIKRGTQSSFGAGIFITSTDASITNCIISDNVSSGSSGFGAGLIVFNNSDRIVTVTNCLFRDNTAYGAGAVYLPRGVINFFGTTFSANIKTNDSPETSDDIMNNGGTITIYSSCSVGESSNWGGE